MRVGLFLLVLQDEKVMDTGYITEQIYLILLNCTLKMFRVVNFMSMRDIILFKTCEVFFRSGVTCLVLCYPAAAAAAKSLQSCPTLCDPIDGSPPGSPFPGILQARTLEWVAISFSNA